MNIFLKETPVFTVGQVTRYIKDLFAADPYLNYLQVSGEISNFKLHSSGHMYFTLKDSEAALRCVMFRSANSRLKFLPQDGMKVVASGRISVFARDGQYQLYVEAMVPDGVGSLYAAYEKLKAKLEAAGFFDAARKKRLPRFPRRIGVVTSPTGAAVRDIVTTLGRRYPQAEVLIVPVLVQGPEAPGQIAEALRFLNTVPGIDVIICGRGGGSIEELWAFNEEIVARAIYDSNIPVISAVGHETDFTIADFVADVRAATPTAAAELAVPDRQELLQFLETARQRLVRKMTDKLKEDRRILEKLAAANVLTRPTQRLEQARQGLDSLFTQLESRMLYYLQGKKAGLELLAGKLAALSPQAVLERGFSLVYDREGRVVRDATRLKPHDLIKIILQHGSAAAVVQQTYTEEENDEE